MFGNQNLVVDVSSQKHSLCAMEVQTIGFEVIKEFYKDDPYFDQIWEE